jgi:hypothetical protein
MARHILSKRDSILSPVKDKATECDLKYLLSATTGHRVWSMEILLSAVIRVMIGKT